MHGFHKNLWEICAICDLLSAEFSSENSDSRQTGTQQQKSGWFRHCRALANDQIISALHGEMSDKISVLRKKSQVDGEDVVRTAQ